MGDTMELLDLDKTSWVAFVLCDMPPSSQALMKYDNTTFEVNRRVNGVTQGVMS